MTVIKSPLADRLGVLSAQKSEIVAQADDVKAEIIALTAERSINVVEGELFRATVSYVDRNVVDYKNVIESLIIANRISREEMADLIRINTKTAEGEPRVRCAARK